jgi:short-subunit dehydrogenase
VEDLDISLVIVAAGTFTLKRYDQAPGKYIEQMLDVNAYHFVMMHKVFIPWLIELRAKNGLRMGLVGFSSISVIR